ncbi:unnamed protein product [Cunninghamella blakesleeana]
MITAVQFSKQRFLLLDRPTNKSLPTYIELLKKENVKYIVRISSDYHDYDTEELERQTGIKVIDDIKFEDGTVPSKEDIQRWLNLAEQAKQQGYTLGCQCVSSIGRAPLLVAIALIESGMDPLDAVSYIRQCRRGALNKTQVRFIDKYKPLSKQTNWKQWFKKITI